MSNEANVFFVPISYAENFLYKTDGNSSYVFLNLLF